MIKRKCKIRDIGLHTVSNGIMIMPHKCVPKYYINCDQRWIVYNLFNITCLCFTSSKHILCSLRIGMTGVILFEVYLIEYYLKNINLLTVHFVILDIKLLLYMLVLTVYLYKHECQ